MRGVRRLTFVVDRARLPEDCARSAGASVAVLGAATAAVRVGQMHAA